MRGPLVWTVPLTAAAAAVASVLIVNLAYSPPDSAAAALAVVWLSGPYILAVLLATFLSRRKTALWALFGTVLLVGLIGVMVYGWVVSSALEARHQVETAVLPGEDPDRGPAAMRKTGADVGAFITDVFSIAALVVVPPLQALGIALAGGIGYGVSVRGRDRAEARRAEAEQSGS